VICGDRRAADGVDDCHWLGGGRVRVEEEEEEGDESGVAVQGGAFEELVPCLSASIHGDPKLRLLPLLSTHPSLPLPMRDTGRIYDAGHGFTDLPPSSLTQILSFI